MAGNTFQFEQLFAPPWELPAAADAAAMAADGIEDPGLVRRILRLRSSRDERHPADAATGIATVEAKPRSGLSSDMLRQFRAATALMRSDNDRGESEAATDFRS